MDGLIRQDTATGSVLVSTSLYQPHCSHSIFVASTQTIGLTIMQIMLLYGLLLYQTMPDSLTIQLWRSQIAFLPLDLLLEGQLASASIPPTSLEPTLITTVAIEVPPVRELSSDPFPECILGISGRKKWPLLSRHNRLEI